MSGRRLATTLALAAPPLLFLLVFFVLPVSAIMAAGLAPAGVLDPTALGAVLSRPFVREVAWFTFWQALLSTLLTVLAALPGAYVLARFDFPGKRLLNSVAVVPFVLPTVVVAAAFLALLGPRSPFGIRLDATIWAILLAHVFYNYAVVLRLVGAAWAQLDPRLEDAARVLGATRLAAFRRVSLPLLAPAIASAASIVFLFTFTSFGVILLLGGPSFATLEVEIYRQAAQLLDLRVAATLALIQGVALLALLLVYARIQQRLAVRMHALPARLVARRPRGVREWLFVGVNLAMIGLLLGLPLALLVERSFATTGGYGLTNYAALAVAGGRGGLFVPPAEAISNSLVFAAGATLIAVGLGALAALLVGYRRGVGATALDALLMLPLGTSGVIVGFGLLLTLTGPLAGLRTSPLLIPIAHAVVGLPFVVRALVPVIRSIEPRLREAAAVLGAPPGRVRAEIDLPIIRRALLVGAGFAFAVSLGEFGATLFIVRPDMPTMPIAVYRLLSQPGPLAFGQAMAMATVLMAVTALSIIVIDRFRLGTGGEF
jgi:thiamine transport system permease protein